MTTTDVFRSTFAHSIFKQKYAFTPDETWAGLSKRVVNAVIAEYDPGLSNYIEKALYNRKFIPGGRYLYASGRPIHQIKNCYLWRAQDSREGWAELMHSSASALMVGGGIGADYSTVRPEGALIKKTGGLATGPIALMNIINELGRHVRQGGQRRSAIWAGLNWSHADALKFLHIKDYSEALRESKRRDINFPLPMELTNISLIYDSEFFVAISNPAHEKHALAKSIFLANCRQAFKTAEPGFAFNFGKDSESLRNACTEVVSSDDGDSCNLGTIWLNRFAYEKRNTALNSFVEMVREGTKFLMHGSEYTMNPTEKVARISRRNNRIGLGLGGMAEFLMAHKSGYEVTPLMHDFLRLYEEVSDETAYNYTKTLRDIYRRDINTPVGIRAIAPTGTIGILAESTTGIEPLFCAAYLRGTAYRREDGKDGWRQTVVVDGTVKTLMERGISLDSIWDSYDLGFEQRVKFQADVQDYVDMAISSTCNMPHWGSEVNNEDMVQTNADILLKYAARLRGFTCYPDGCRDGQPLVRTELRDALKAEGTIYDLTEQECVGGVCGT